MDSSHIDWNRIWNDKLAEVSGRHHNKERWDHYASKYDQWSGNDNLPEQVLPLLDVRPSDKLLDIGCGSGALALPLARRVAAVTALDPSAAMLDLLRRKTRRLGLRNIDCLEMPWQAVRPEQNLAPHDVVLASRSLGLTDIREQLLKMHHLAKRSVYLVWRLGLRPLDALVHRHLARPYHEYPGTDILYNLLHQLGFHARQNVLRVRQAVGFADLADAVAHFRWKIGDLTPAEEIKLEAFLAGYLEKTLNRGLQSRQLVSRWALLGWHKEEYREK
ncbi:MAG: class I SAM-dependent methyltransferase [Desulfobacteraceae bacterium]|nr:MAG: class I SAM-dependent methyltransferase [Desulfobacteraceae bacterium]